MILQYCISCGRLKSHLCILVLHIHLDSNVCVCAATQAAVLRIKIYQAFCLSRTEGVIHLETQLALNLHYSILL